MTQADYTRQRKKKKRKTIALVALAVVLVLVLGGAGVAFAYLQTINSNLHKGVTEELKGALVDTQYAGDPFYMLLMGTDGSEERASSAEYEATISCSDSRCSYAVDPEGKKVTMVSLHRDTMVDMGVNGTQKLNAAHSIGGSAYTVQVVSEMAGVDISHYAEIDFDGFKEIVDALGGVEVDVPMEINDNMAGGYVSAGLQTLNGDQALILCRARHAYDEYGDGRPLPGGEPAVGPGGHREQGFGVRSGHHGKHGRGAVPIRDDRLRRDRDREPGSEPARHGHGKRPVHRHGAYHVRVHQRDLVRAS